MTYETGGALQTADFADEQELVGMLGVARATMPSPALDAVRRMGAASMPPVAWEVVREEAGL
jgi:hypothetical protein